MTLQLRDYQQQGIDGLRRGFVDGHLRQILCNPTGAGKTETAAALVMSVKDKGGKVLFIVDRLTLLSQAAARFRKYGLQVGIYQGENTDYRADDDVRVATAQTLWSRMKDNPLSLDCSLIIVDEAHILFQSHRKIFERMDSTPVVGLTATPHHRELGKWYSSVQCPITTQDLIDREYLVPFRVFQPDAQIDTDGIRMQARDFNTREMGKRVTRITADVISNWEANGEDRPTLAFCVNVTHAEELAYQFNQAGIPAAWIYYKTEEQEREDIFQKFADGEIKVLCSVTTLTAGFDMPSASCCIVARPTASEALHIQILGRVARPDTGKVDSIVFDHAGNTRRHGLPQDYLPPTLEEVEDRSAPKREAKDKVFPTCQNCSACMRRGQRICDNCGHERTLSSDIVVEDDQLIEVGKDLPQSVANDPLFREHFLAELKGYADGRLKRDGTPYSPRWAAGKYKERFSHWPEADGFDYYGIDPIEPGAAVLRWVDNQRKRYLIARKAMQQKGVHNVRASA